VTQIRKLNIGLIGYKFMGKAHSHAYKDVSMFFDLPAQPVMKALCGRDEAGVKEAAARFGWESHETSWEALLKRDDICLFFNFSQYKVCEHFTGFVSSCMKNPASAVRSFQSQNQFTVYVVKVHPGINQL